MKLSILFFLVVGYGQCDVFSDLDYLVSILPGVYDNFKQYESDIAAGVPPGERHLYMTTSVVEEDVPLLLDTHNLYLEQYLDGDRSKMTRQKLYSFSVDSDLQIHLEIYSFVDPARVAHSKPHAPIFKKLTKEDLVYSVGCDVFWDRLSQDLFKSRMYNTCIVIADGFQYVITDINYLSSSYLTVNERWYFANNGSTYRYNPIPYNETKHTPLIHAEEDVNKTRISHLKTLRHHVRARGKVAYTARRVCDCRLTRLEEGVLSELRESGAGTHMRALVLAGNHSQVLHSLHFFEDSAIVLTKSGVRCRYGWEEEAISLFKIV